MDVCTIIAKNYLAYARVLGRSLAEHEPDVRFKVLIIDEIEGYVDPKQEPFDVVTIDELEIENFARMAVMYSVLELSTAVKPWLLRWLLANSSDGVAVYLDPDMRVYAPLTEMLQAVRDHGLVLNPHFTDPMPRDGRKPDEQDILIAGAYNLGFIGIGSGAFADQLLDWWGERLERDCIVDPARGFFVDQRWIDLVPGMAEDFYVLRDPGFNVAYWNLPTRTVSERDGTWYVNGDVPLKLVHFSGFDASKPHLLSKHQDRIRLIDEPALAKLCEDYATELIEHGVDEVSEWPYTYDASASGVPLDALNRRIYRDLLREGFEDSLFEKRGAAAFMEAASAPADIGREYGVTRYLATLHRLRGDLKARFPDLGNPIDGRGYVEWAHTVGRGEVPIPDDVLPPTADLASGGSNDVSDQTSTSVQGDRKRATQGSRFGVNVVGYLNSELGVGEVARQVIDALDEANVATLPVGVTPPGSRQGHRFAHVGASPDDYPVNLVCVNADMLPGLAAHVGPHFFRERYTIGLWWWEASVFPQLWASSFGYVDELWAGSQFVAETLKAASPVPVVHMPMPVTLPPVTTPRRADVGLPEGFVFLFIYDFNSVLARKNPLGLLDAFLRAFPDPADGAQLVLKSINAERHPNEHDMVKFAARGHPHVHLLDFYVSPDQKNGMLASADCYASLHRSEGFGITIAEAMLLGKPVVATAYSGNLDFMRPENSYLVDYELTSIGAGHDPYPPDAEWAEPDLRNAATLLRQVFDDQKEARRRGEIAAADIRRSHSALASGTAMERRLERSRAKVPIDYFDPTELARRDAAAAQELVRVGQTMPTATRAAKLRRAPRAAVLRLIKPHTSYEHQVDRRVTDALSHLGHAVESLEGRVDALAARERESASLMLRELRSIDRLTRRVEEHERALGGVGLTAPVSTDEAPAGFDGEPWTREYDQAHRSYAARALDDAELLTIFREGAALPAGLGHGLDERVVEFPWLAAQRLGGRVLDAGSTLNHLHVLQRLRPRTDDLHIVTLAPEERSFPHLGVSYLYADLRELPLADDIYDRVLSISTLEHVGTDTSYFGGTTAVAEDPQKELLAAVAELKRVLRPGGDCYITVPTGKGERYDWVRSLTPEEIDEIVETFRPATSRIDYFRYSDGCWRRSDRGGIADAKYRDHFTSDGVGPDGVVAAEAVACLHLVKPK